MTRACGVTDKSLLKIKADAPEEKLDELVRIAQERSPVFDCVSNPVPVAVTRAK